MSKAEQLIEQYLVTMEELQMAEHDHDGVKADNANDDLHFLAKDLTELKPYISAEVSFEKTGVKRVLCGQLHSIRKDKVYFESVLGLVEGDASTMAEDSEPVS